MIILCFTDQDFITFLQVTHNSSFLSWSEWLNSVRRTMDLGVQWAPTPGNLAVWTEICFHQWNLLEPSKGLSCLWNLQHKKKKKQTWETLGKVTIFLLSVYILPLSLQKVALKKQVKNWQTIESGLSPSSSGLKVWLILYIPTFSLMFFHLS